MRRLCRWWDRNLSIKVFTEYACIAASWGVLLRSAPSTSIQRTSATEAHLWCVAGGLARLTRLVSVPICGQGRVADSRNVATVLTRQCNDIPRRRSQISPGIAAYSTTRRPLQSRLTFTTNDGDCSTQDRCLSSNVLPLMKRHSAWKGCYSHSWRRTDLLLLVVSRSAFRS